MRVLHLAMKIKWLAATVLGLGGWLGIVGCAGGGPARALSVGTPTTNFVIHLADETSWPIYTLAAEQTWLCNLPDGRAYDASGLLFLPDGSLLTVNNRSMGLHRVEFAANTNVVNLVPLTNCFTKEQIAPFASEKVGPYDCEGIAQDEQGRVYLCEEGNRWILRWNPKTFQVERLPIDWTSVTNYFSADRNASFEGIAIGNGKLYVANERSEPVIIVVDLASLKVVEHFVVRPETNSLLGILHYSDLCWFEGKLFVMCRQHRVVLEVEPATHRVLAEFNYRELEDSLGYMKNLPVGVMEGLAVDRDFIWLCTDNNGLARFKYPKDIRPTLLKCRRPDRRK